MSTKQDTHDRLIAKAQSDPSFRNALLTDTNGAIAAELGGSVPDGVTITVVEETPQKVYVVLPAAPAEGGELSDDQLSTVAGGAGSHHSDCSWGATCGAGSLIGDC